MTITPATYDFNVWRNGDVRQDVMLKIDGVILDLTGYVARLEIRPSLTDTNPPLLDINSTAPTVNFSQIYLTDYAAATGALTSSANYADGETVTIGTRVYTFQTTLTNTDGHVHIGLSEVASIANLHHAINNSGGVPGTDYFVTQADPNVTATDDGAHVVTVTQKNTLTAAQANALATTETSATASWGGLTLSGGADSKLQIFIDDRDLSAHFPLAKTKDGQTTYVYDLLLTAPGGEPGGDVDPYLTGKFVLHNGVTR